MLFRVHILCLQQHSFCFSILIKGYLYSRVKALLNANVKQLDMISAHGPIYIYTCMYAFGCDEDEYTYMACVNK